MVNGDLGRSFLECTLIRDFNVFLDFSFSVLRPVISAVFLERLLYLSLSFPKQFYLSDMMDSE